MASETYAPIDVNEYMEMLQPRARYRFMDKVKGGLHAPFKLWSWKKNGSSGISTHFLWKIPSKQHHELRQQGKSKAATIIVELTSIQEKHCDRAVMSAYFGFVGNPDFISS
jgi:hypothetical protein